MVEKVKNDVRNLLGRKISEIGKKIVSASTRRGDRFGGPVDVENYVRNALGRKVSEIGKTIFLASTRPGDHFGGPAEVEMLTEYDKCGGLA